MRHDKPFSVRVYTKDGAGEPLHGLYEYDDANGAFGSAVLWQRLDAAVRIEVVQHATAEHSDRLLAQYIRCEANGLFYDMLNADEKARLAEAQGASEEEVPMAHRIVPLSRDTQYWHGLDEESARVKAARAACQHADCTAHAVYGGYCLTHTSAPACPICDDGGRVDDPGPNDGCWATTAYCMCPAGRALKADDLDVEDRFAAVRASGNDTPMMMLDEQAGFGGYAETFAGAIADRDGLSFANARVRADEIVRARHHLSALYRESTMDSVVINPFIDAIVAFDRAVERHYGHHATQMMLGRLMAETRRGRESA